MADEAKTDDAQAKGEGSPGGSKKILLIVVAIMVLETIGVGAFIFLSGGSPSVAEADIIGDAADSPDSLVEVQLVAERFQNMHTGRAWQWEAEVFIKVRKKDEERVTEELERRRAEITAGVGELIRKATHSHLREPELQTLKRKLETYMGEVFGVDAENETRVTQVLVPKLRGTPADF